MPPRFASIRVRQYQVVSEGLGESRTNLLPVKEAEGSSPLRELRIKEEAAHGGTPDTAAVVLGGEVVPEVGGAPIRLGVRYDP